MQPIVNVCRKLIRQKTTSILPNQTTCRKFMLRFLFEPKCIFLFLVQNFIFFYNHTFDNLCVKSYHNLTTHKTTSNLPSQNTGKKYILRFSFQLTCIFLFYYNNFQILIFSKTTFFTTWHTNLFRNLTRNKTNANLLNHTI